MSTSIIDENRFFVRQELSCPVDVEPVPLFDGQTSVTHDGVTYCAVRLTVKAEGQEPRQCYLQDLARMLFDDGMENFVPAGAFTIPLSIKELVLAEYDRFGGDEDLILFGDRRSRGKVKFCFQFKPEDEEPAELNLFSLFNTCLTILIDTSPS